MKSCRICVAAIAMLAGVMSAQAHQVEPDAKIVMKCRAGWTPYIDDVVYALDHSGYTATPSARREMLTLARHACASGSIGVAFAPPPDQRQGSKADAR